MRERPLLFRGELVREILAGRKTMTRRPVKPAWSRCLDLEDEADRAKALEQCPYGHPGDRLWVRERFSVAEVYSYGTLPSGDEIVHRGVPRGPVHYHADGDPPNVPNRTYPNGLRNGAFAAPDPYAIWIGRPSIHMPRWASRLTLDIVAVGLERLTCIVACDAEKEGVADVAAFAAKWDEIHGAGAFRGDPWVWVVQFRRVEEVPRAVA
jgi:hypothetical protein